MSIGVLNCEKDPYPGCAHSPPLHLPLPLAPPPVGVVGGGDKRLPGKEKNHGRQIQHGGLLRSWYVLSVERDLLCQCPESGLGLPNVRLPGRTGGSGWTGCLGDCPMSIIIALIGVGLLFATPVVAMAEPSWAAYTVIGGLILVVVGGIGGRNSDK